MTHRQAIAGLVESTVAQWDGGEVADRIELEVGRDLQYIRLNGTLIGGIVGVAIHAVYKLCP